MGKAQKLIAGISHAAAGSLAGLLLVMIPLHAFASGYSLNQILADAKKNNPNQQANELNVEAYKLDAKGARADSIYPQITVSGSSVRSQYNQGLPGTNAVTAGVTATETLYDGGAARHNVKALRWSAQAQEALYNSTDPYVPYTAGSVAQNVFNYFTAWNSDRALYEFELQQKAEWDQVLPLVKDPKAVSDVQTTIAGIVVQIQKLQKDMASAMADLCHYSYTDLPANIDDFEDTNNQMIKDLADYYDDPNKAIATAKLRNQDYLARWYQLQETMEETKSLRASLTRPVVQLVMGETYNQTNTYGAGVPVSGSAGPYVGIQFTMPVSFGMRDHLQASEYRTRAAAQNVAQQELDFKYSIYSTITKLHDTDSELSWFRTQMTNDHNVILDFINSHVQANQEFTEDDIHHLTSLYGAYTNAWGGGNGNSSYFGVLITAVTLRYQLEVSIGILFDTLKPYY